jgi:hypothetical protein
VAISSEQRLRGQKEAWSDDCNQLVFHAWNCSTSMKLGKALACIVLIGDYHLRYGISLQRSLAERVRLRVLCGSASLCASGEESQQVNVNSIRTINANLKMMLLQVFKKFNRKLCEKCPQ